MGANVLIKETLILLSELINGHDSKIFINSNQIPDFYFAN